MNTIPDRLGQFGSISVHDTTAQTGNWHAIQCLWSAAVFSTCTDAGTTNVGSTGTMALGVGQIMYGSFTAFTLASGSVKAYKSRSA